MLVDSCASVPSKRTDDDELSRLPADVQAFVRETVQPTSDLLARAQLRARGRPSELELARTSAEAPSALDAAEAAIVVSR